MESLLVIKANQPLSAERLKALKVTAKNIEADLGMKVVVIEEGLEPSVHHDLSGLVSALHAQAESIGNLAAVTQSVLAEMLEEEERQPAVDLSGEAIS